jgi:hypothetical protein
MKGKKSFVIITILFAVFSLALVGCSKKEAAVEEKPDVVHNDFVFFQEEYENENGESIGDLYIKPEGKEKEKISSKVMDGNFDYINSQNKVLFINEENELYQYKIGKEKEKIAKDVTSFRGNFSDEIVAYQKDDFDLYVIKGDAEDEKIASNVSQYDIVGNNVYFIDDDGDFSIYNMDKKQETEIASDVMYFTDLNNKDEIAYLDEDQSLYFRKIGEDESIKITSDEVSSDSIKKIGDQLVYLNIEDGESAELYQSRISSGATAKKIASDIRYYKYSQGYFYYVNNDDNLFKKKDNEEESTKVASDVSEFTIKKNSIFYMDTDNKLFSIKDGKKAEKIASSVMEYDVTPDGDVVYLTEDMNLFVNSKKIASDIQQYKHFYGNVAFSTKDDKLFLMKDMGEKKLVEGDLNQFSNASYQNRRIYQNYLTFEDIAGVWKIDDMEGSYYLEIDKDGGFTYLLSGEKEHLNLDYSGYHSLNASAKGTDFKFERGKDQTLMITMDDSTETFSKSTKAEAEEYVKKVQLENDKEEISGLMDDYINNFTDAVNYGNDYYIKEYLYSGSPFYQQQIDFVHNAYENDISEYLKDYNIESINSASEGVYTVTMTETFNIYEGYGAEGTMKTFKNTYTVKKIDDEFLITDLKVSQTNSEAL